jgi:DNA invertase Pin-like site-specific DNA recombinase
LGLASHANGRSRVPRSNFDIVKRSELPEIANAKFMSSMCHCQCAHAVLTSGMSSLATIGDSCIIRNDPQPVTVALPTMIAGGERRYVAYYRVSTGQQRESGFGLESQQAQVRDYVTANHGRLIGEYSETVSGRKNDRPQLAMALTTCRIMGAVLVIARLDRLSRNVAMVARLMESGVYFVATDFPYANKFTIHVLAAVAEYEAGIQSERMKAVLAAMKQRGIKVGNTRRDSTRRFPPGCQQASVRARQERAEARRRDLAPLVWQSIAEGKSHRVIADEFNQTGVAPARQSKWTKNAIWRIASMTAGEFGALPEVAAVRRVGVAQIKVRRRVDEIGPLLLTWRGERWTYQAIASELRRRGIESPWGGEWGQASIGRYVKRAMGVSALRPARRAAK